jgi:nucleotide-binding universal stress UspA family protein
MDLGIGKENCILVPTDFSDTCRNALLHAVEISKVSMCKIYLLHIIGETNFPTISNNDLVDNDKYLEVNNPLKHIGEKLQQLINECKIDTIKPFIRKGDFFVTINDVIEEVNADLMIVGTHGKVGIQKIFGSNVIKIIDNTDIPVIVVQDYSVPKIYKKIVFPIKVKSGDRQKTHFTGLLALATQSEIHIFPFFGKSGTDFRKVFNEVIQVYNYFNKYGIERKIVENLRDDDDFNQQILDYSVSENADLIVIISNSDKHHIISGAPEESLLFNKSYIPVLCLNRKKVRHSAAGGLVTGN